jgi:predicted dienelactone hydrolase
MTSRIAGIIAGVVLLVMTPCQSFAQSFTAGMMQLPPVEFPGARVPGVPVTVWYPSKVPEKILRLGDAELSVALDAVPVSGRRRLILISHGSEGSDLQLSNLARLLARRGMVVVAPRHLGDSFDDKSAHGSSRQFGGRPYQASYALDVVLKHPKLSKLINPNRIGAVGYSAGGYTTLVLAGAKPDRQIWIRHCQQPVRHGAACPVGGWLTSLGLRFFDDWDRPPETRIKSLVLLAPFGVMFDKAGLANVKVPVLMFQPERDDILPNAFHGEMIRDALPRKSDFRTVPGGHFIFVQPCSADLAAAAPRVCIDQPGIDRAKIQQRTNGQIADFFASTLRSK